MMSFARSWRVKLGSWAVSEGCRPLMKLSQHWQAAGQLRVWACTGQGHLRRAGPGGSGLSTYRSWTWNYPRYCRVNINTYD